MIEGIEEFYQRIADSIVDAISEEWSIATVEATFYPDGEDYYCEYVRAVDGVPRSFLPSCCREEVFRQLRQKFKKDQKPLWGSAKFELSSDGKFKMNWNYDDCDEQGYARWDADEWLKKQQERQHRLTRPALVDRQP